ncbi:hypothetical protein JXJ21_16865 [candidate division KSB1 bacterium]|nr:hypothetical protein [candidate division KSB1 bacterium]
MKLDAEEKQIIAEYEKGNIETRKPAEDELAEIKSAAAKTLRKERRIAKRISLNQVIW